MKFVIALFLKSVAKIRSIPLETLIAILVLYQFLDGILTFFGISKYGIYQEGNPLLRELMLRFGVGQTLFVAKITAVMLLYFIRDLYRHSQSQMSFVIPCLHAIVVFYTLGAIIPWMILLIY